MNSYGLKITDTEDGKGLKVEMGGLTPETVDPRNIGSPEEITPAIMASLEIINLLEKYGENDKGDNDNSN